ncbi:AAA family ATPase [Anaerolineales bacterium HSG24]|nr:AAA family ATPase [Anaerolineales bacterium HSG24]
MCFRSNIILTIEGYQINEQIYESSNSQVYRGIREADSQAVILKMLQGEYPTPKQLSNYHQEYELTRSVELPGVVKVYGLESYHNSLIMVVEDFGGHSLKQLKLGGQLPVAEFLHLAIQISDILGQVHQHEVIHKDINPANIVLNPETGEVKLIDFGLSTRLSRELPTFRNPEVLEGTLAYISPEQTGRMNRGVDYRTDLYSLGVMLYELLTGQLPFQGHDALELIHNHIAKQPVPPQTIVLQTTTQQNKILTEPTQTLIEIVSDIILKLLAKNAEDRYQSAYGLKADLAHCLRVLETAEVVEGFALGQQDVSDKFQIPQKLYGRQAEIRTLLQGFEQVIKTGSADMILVAGYSGVGKSALIQEIHKPITAQQGYFLAGKFDQYQRNIPYTSLIQAFRMLIKQLLTERGEQIAVWKDKLLTAFGPNGQLIIDIIPEVELIIGPQPAVPELGPVESQNRFNLVFQNFIGVFTQPEHPLVLFLDDLQWADEASLKLLELLMTSGDSHYLYLIGAYRDNEVSAGHPLLLTLVDIKKADIPINQLTLAPLPLEHVTRLISETVHQPTTEVTTLAELVYQKTGGNPFFLTEFLKALYYENLINFDLTAGRWIWDLEQITARQMTDNVVELMTEKVSQLEAECQHVLKQAACIGNQFELSTLAVVSERTSHATATALAESIASGLVLPLSEDYALLELDVEGIADELEASYKFAHDRIQQAAYSMIPEVERQTVHYHIGRLMLGSIPAEEQEEYIFDIVNQLNQGHQLIEAQTERNQLAELNLLAGKKAKQANAYQSAIDYFVLGRSLLGKKTWATHYRLMFELYKEQGEAEFLVGNHDRSNELLNIALERAISKFDKAAVYIIKIAQLVGQGQYPDAIAVTREVLNLFGLNIPAVEQTELIKKATETELALYKENMQSRQIKDLWDLPPMEDEEMKVCSQAMGKVMVAIVLGVPQLLALCTTKMVNISIEYGLSDSVPASYVFHSFTEALVLNNLEAAYDVTDLGLRLHLEKSTDQSVKSKVYHMAAWFAILKEPLKVGVEYQQMSYRAGLEVGDLAFAGYAYTGIIRLLTPISIDETLVEYERAVTLLTKTNDVPMLLLANLVGGFAKCLKGQTANKDSLDHGDFTVAGYIEIFGPVAPTLVGYAKRYQMLPLVIFELFEDALPFVHERAKWMAGGMVDFVYLSDYHLFAGLTVSDLYEQVSSTKQQEYMEILDECMENLKLLANQCEANFLHSYLILQAEKARIENRPLEAMKLYEQGIQSAKKHEYTQSEALGNERAAKFYFAQGLDRVAMDYMREAHYAYQRWGATAKAKDLEEKYPTLLNRPTTTMQTSITQTLFTTMYTHGSTSSNTSVSGQLDLESVIKATKIISGEIKLSRLLEKMMRIVVENAGAQRGLLILQQDEQWLLQAKLEINPEVIELLQAIPIKQVGGASQDPELSVSIVTYVIRTQEDVVLNDAMTSEQFARAEYIDKIEPKSVLCMPLLNQGRTSGVLYLENNLSKGAFTPERLVLLKMLSSQMAVSLENSLLYNNLETLVEQRTQELQATLDNLRSTQSQLIEAEKMAALGGLVAGVAHEINTPVGIGVTTASALVDNSEKVSQAYQAGKLGKMALQSYLQGAVKSSELILRNLQRASELVSSFKQVAVDQSNLERRSFKVVGYLNEILFSLRPQLKQTAHEIVVEGNELIELDTYPGALAQIITNLMMNSVKHGYDEGESGRLQISVGQETNKVIIHYSDDGKGIPSENLPRIFEPFFTTARNRGGTGLGMHIVYNLVTQKLGGMIECESVVEQGTTFVITL